MALSWMEPTAYSLGAWRGYGQVTQPPRMRYATMSSLMGRLGRGGQDNRTYFEHNKWHSSFRCDRL